MRDLGGGLADDGRGHRALGRRRSCAVARSRSPPPRRGPLRRSLRARRPRLRKLKTCGLPRARRRRRARASARSSSACSPVNTFATRQGQRRRVVAQADPVDAPARAVQGGLAHPHASRAPASSLARADDDRVRLGVGREHDKCLRAADPDPAPPPDGELVPAGRGAAAAGARRCPGGRRDACRARRCERGRPACPRPREATEAPGCWASRATSSPAAGAASSRTSGSVSSASGKRSRGERGRKRSLESTKAVLGGVGRGAQQRSL